MAPCATRRPSISRTPPRCGQEAAGQAAQAGPVGSLALHPSRVEVGVAGGRESLETEPVMWHLPSSVHHAGEVALSSRRPLDLRPWRAGGPGAGVSTSERRVGSEDPGGKDTLPSGQSKGCLHFTWPRCGFVGVEGRRAGAGLYPRQFPGSVRGSLGIGITICKARAEECRGGGDPA